MAHRNLGGMRLTGLPADFCAHHVVSQTVESHVIPHMMAPPSLLLLCIPTSTPSAGGYNARLYPPHACEQVAFTHDERTCVLTGNRFDCSGEPRARQHPLPCGCFHSPASCVVSTSAELNATSFVSAVPQAMCKCSGYHCAASVAEKRKRLNEVVAMAKGTTQR